MIQPPSISVNVYFNAHIYKYLYKKYSKDLLHYLPITFETDGINGGTLSGKTYSKSQKVNVYNYIWYE